MSLAPSRAEQSLFVPTQGDAERRLQREGERRLDAPRRFTPTAPPLIRLTGRAIAFQQGRRGTQDPRLSPEQEKALREGAPVAELTRLGLTQEGPRGEGVSPFRALSNVAGVVEGAAEEALDIGRDVHRGVDDVAIGATRGALQTAFRVETPTERIEKLGTQGIIQRAAELGVLDVRSLSTEDRRFFTTTREGLAQLRAAVIAREQEQLKGLDPVRRFLREDPKNLAQAVSQAPFTTDISLEEAGDPLIALGLAVPAGSIVSGGLAGLSMDISAVRTAGEAIRKVPSTVAQRVAPQRVLPERVPRVQGKGKAPTPDETPGVVRDLEQEVAEEVVQSVVEGDQPAAGLGPRVTQPVALGRRAKPGDLNAPAPEAPFSASGSLDARRLKDVDLPANAAKVASETQEALVARLTSVIKEAKPAREVLEREVTAELGIRAAKAKAALARGDRNAAFAAFKGELPKTADFEAFARAFTPSEGEALRGMITQQFKDSPFKWMQAETAFTNLFDVGNLPNRSQLAILEEVFGEAFVNAVLKQRNLPGKLWDTFVELWNVPRALVASGEVSASLRQGGVFVFENKGRDWIRAFNQQIKAFRSPANAEASAAKIAAHPMFEASQRAGLDLTVPGTLRKGAELAAREEPFIGARPVTVAVNVPAPLSRLPFGNFTDRRININLLGRFVASSERAYVTMLNELRFAKFVREAEALGRNAKSSDLAALARNTNILTGRANLGRATGLSQVLNGVFFSPRFAVSRFQVPFTLASRSAAARKAAASALVSYTTTVLGMLGLADLTNVTKVEWDPRSSDFAKFRVGNTRIDPWMGLQQPAVLVMRLLSGQRKTLSDETIQELDAGQAVGQFFENKLSPSSRVLLNRGEGFRGEAPLDPSPLPNVPRIVFDNFVFLFVQDILDAIQEEGAAGALVAPLSALGVGVQSFSRDDQTTPTGSLRERIRDAFSPSGQRAIPEADIGGQIRRAFEEAFAGLAGG